MSCGSLRFTEPVEENKQGPVQAALPNTPVGHAPRVVRREQGDCEPASLQRVVRKDVQQKSGCNRAVRVGRNRPIGHRSELAEYGPLPTFLPGSVGYPCDENPPDNRIASGKTRGSSKRSLPMAFAGQVGRDFRGQLSTCARVLDESKCPRLLGARCHRLLDFLGESHVL